RSRELGASAGVLYGDPSWPRTARELSPRGRGFDVVLDSVGTWQQSIDALRPGGRLVVLGASRAEHAHLDVRRFYSEEGKPMTGRVRYEVDDRGAAFVTLDAPESRNALSDELLDDLLDAFERARTDDAVRVAVLTSSHDRVFSAGGDLKAFTGDAPTIGKYAGLDRFPRLYKLIGGLGKPVICAANGDVLAGAFGLALACDLVIAREGVRFGCPEINVGVFPFMISALIYRNIDRMKANELMMLGEPIDAAEAHRLNIVNAVVPAASFDKIVREWAHKVAGKSPLLMRLGKNAIDATRDMSLPDALEALRAQLALAFTTEDLAEGVAAFREKREAVWKIR
ncbi:MAG TPA: enoyl-CoA hydratase-related protein, partial [Solirubrobacterales bacterium]|nr:enoyl-CoA hydratase-related protein [Solirubrobacterales bacterium]